MVDIPNTFQNGQVADAEQVNENFTALETGKTDVDSWVPVSDTFEYDTTTTFTIAGVDRTDIYTAGTKVKLDFSGSTKYYWVRGSSFSTDTTVKVTGETDLASATITNPYYSRAEAPEGMKNARDEFQAHAYSSSQTIFSDTTYTQITLGTEVYDPNSNFASNTYTAPIDGVYQIAYNSRLNDTTYKLAHCLVALYLNGALVARTRFQTIPSTAYTMRFYTGGGLFSTYLTKGDTIKLYGWGDTTDSGAFNTDAGASHMAVNFQSIKPLDP